MQRQAETEKLALIEECVQRARVGASEGAPDERFIRGLYRNVAPEDILPRGAESLYGAAASLWSFMENRRPGKPKIRLLGPGAKGEDWLGDHGVFQIVNDDMPFLVDSLSAALLGLDLRVTLTIHPVFAVERDSQGQRLGLAEGLSGDLIESLMHIEFAGAGVAAREGEILDRLDRVLADVRAAVVDWAGMTRRVTQLADELAGAILPLPASEVAEVSAFLTWLGDDNFTFLGYREYGLGAEGLKVLANVGKGILRDDDYLVFDGLRNFTQLAPDMQQFVRSPQLVMISKSNRRSTVHRPVHMDAVFIKSFDADGGVVGLKLMVGLFTSGSYSQTPRVVPVLRRKVQRCLERSGFAAGSHNGKALQHILDTYPRDELFQIDERDLYQTAIGILHLQERQRIALFVRRDPFERFISALVFVPRDRYTAEVRRRMATILETRMNGTIAADSTHLDESALARIHFIVATTPGQVPEFDTAAVERDLVEAARVWADRLSDVLRRAHGDAAGGILLGRFADAFPTSYSERTRPEQALSDIARVETVRAGLPITVALGPGAEGVVGELRLKTFHADEPVALSDVLPMLENLGLRVINENPFEVRPKGGGSIWVQEFQLRTRGESPVDPAEVAARFEEAFASVWSGELENDGFNRLVLFAGLSAREVVILRAYAKFLRQAGSTFSQTYMEDSVSAHPAIARDLVRLFEASLNPRRPEVERVTEAAAITARIEAALEAVSNLDEDRILRGFLLVISKTLRTNFFQRDAGRRPKPYVSFKLASREIDLLPLPRPMVEISVYSPRTEGCHLRGGMVARGGIRWSDRREDFRTEILGLMKAQMVKNSVIVPVGSKGGFVVKHPPMTGGRDALMAEVVACYKTLMAGLLDITDTIRGDTIVPPREVVRRDGDDPYLVVAADKGTATFSDIANGVALDYGFWLGDAFASGGSVGYDHKAMGITARGAWEAVKRHFRELGTDIQTTDFTCIGVGDMSGDVFGNGMLLSPHTRLLAAFNHQHIFIDPDPDPAASWAERKRLFDLPRSSWTDYDGQVLSPGGAIYERSAKTIVLSEAARARFGISAHALTPTQLIRALLTLPVDLLWFGGIGTYVKASTESHADAGDRTNDALRVDGRDLQARVIGEGANLAMTQAARIEYALGGGRLNTDAIDNSAGVDTSDHEVNIKIAVGNMMASGRLDPAARGPFLASMTDEVGTLVLEDNYLQTLALTLAEAEAPALLDQHLRLMRSLERQGRLDRAIEYLPDDEVVAQRTAAKRGLTRPELAVLLAYAKNAVYAELLDTDLPDEPALEVDLIAYFPTRMREAAVDDLKTHRLRREIIATVVTNDMINRMGPSFVVEMQAKTGRGTADIARAYRIARDVFALPALWGALEAHDNEIPTPTQTRLFLEARIVAEQATRWLLESGLALDIALRTAEFMPGVAALGAALYELLPDGERASFDQRRAPYLAEGVPESLTTRVVTLANLASGLDIVRLAAGLKLDLPDLARVFYAAGEQLGFDALRDFLRAMPAITSWQRLAVGALVDDFYGLQRDLVRHALQDGTGDVKDRLTDWIGARAEAVARIQEMVAEIGRAARPDLAMMTVASRQLRALAV